jgi:replication initiation protein RepC
MRAVVGDAEALRDRAEEIVKTALSEATEEASGAQERSDDSMDLDPAGPLSEPQKRITTDVPIDKSNHRNPAFRKSSSGGGKAEPFADRISAQDRNAVRPPSSGPGNGSGRHEHGTSYISRSMTLGLLPNAMKEFLQQLMPNIRGATWANLIDLAYWHLGELGISEGAWRQACERIGRTGAAIAVFIIAAKRREIRKPDRYLRSMAYRADAGQLQLHRSAWGILSQGRSEQGQA